MVWIASYKILFDRGTSIRKDCNEKNVPKGRKVENYFSKKSEKSKSVKKFYKWLLRREKKGNKSEAFGEVTEAALVLEVKDFWSDFQIIIEKARRAFHVTKWRFLQFLFIKKTGEYEIELI